MTIKGPFQPKLFYDSTIRTSGQRAYARAHAQSGHTHTKRTHRGSACMPYSTPACGVHPPPHTACTHGVCTHPSAHTHTHSVHPVMQAHTERPSDPFPSSSRQGLHLTALTFQLSWRVAWQLQQPVPQASGMHLARSLRLMGVQVLQVVANSSFSSSGRDFACPVPVLRCLHSRGVGREVASED